MTSQSTSREIKRVILSKMSSPEVTRFWQKQYSRIAHVIFNRGKSCELVAMRSRPHHRPPTGARSRHHWIGRMVRKRLGLKTEQRHGGYMIVASEGPTLTRRFMRNMESPPKLLTLSTLLTSWRRMSRCRQGNAACTKQPAPFALDHPREVRKVKGVNQTGKRSSVTGEDFGRETAPH
jgi:hypothetical protein